MGICQICRAEIKREEQWTLSGQMNRVHANPDDCIAVLHPEVTRAYEEANSIGTHLKQRLRNLQ